MNRLALISALAVAEMFAIQNGFRGIPIQFQSTMSYNQIPNKHRKHKRGKPKHD